MARILEETGSLLQLAGENPFKCRAYFNAASIVRGLEDDLENTVRSGRLRAIRGIGNTLQENIREIVETGRLRLHEELQAPYPPGFMEMLQLPGLTPKRLKTLWERLRIASLEDLDHACRKNRLAGLEGFGSKSLEKILKGIAFRKEHEGIFLVDVARRRSIPLCTRTIRYGELIESQKISGLQAAPRAACKPPLQTIGRGVL